MTIVIRTDSLQSYKVYHKNSMAS